jgi:hypothetical protein
VICERCGGEFERATSDLAPTKTWGGARRNSGGKPRWCPECRPAVRREQARKKYEPSGRAGAGVVYFVGHPSMEWPIKIGCCRAAQLERRLKQIQSCSPIRVELLASVESASIFATERELHLRFAAERLHGEWFAPSQVLVALVRFYAAFERLRARAMELMS